MEYRIPLKWEMRGALIVNKETLEQAVDEALSEESLLPQNGEFVEHSLQVDFGRLYALARASFPDSDLPFIECLMADLKKERKNES